MDPGRLRSSNLRNLSSRLFSQTNHQVTTANEIVDLKNREQLNKVSIENKDQTLDNHKQVDNEFSFMKQKNNDPNSFENIGNEYHQELLNNPKPNDLFEVTLCSNEPQVKLEEQIIILRRRVQQLESMVQVTSSNSNQNRTSRLQFTSSTEVQQRQHTEIEQLYHQINLTKQQNIYKNGLIDQMQALIDSYQMENSKEKNLNDRLLLQLEEKSVHLNELERIANEYYISKQKYSVSLINYEERINYYERLLRSMKENQFRLIDKIQRLSGNNVQEDDQNRKSICIQTDRSNREAEIQTQQPLPVIKKKEVSTRKNNFIDSQKMMDKSYTKTDIKYVQKLIEIEVPVFVDRVTCEVQEKIVEKTVEVQKVVEVPVYVDRIVETIKQVPIYLEREIVVHKYIEIEKISEEQDHLYTCIEYPLEIQLQPEAVHFEVPVEIVRIQQRLVDKFVDRIIEVPVEKVVYVQVPVFIDWQNLSKSQENPLDSDIKEVESEVFIINEDQISKRRKRSQYYEVPVEIAIDKVVTIQKEVPVFVEIITFIDKVTQVVVDREIQIVVIKEITIQKQKTIFIDTLQQQDQVGYDQSLNSDIQHLKLSMDQMQFKYSKQLSGQLEANQMLSKCNQQYLSRIDSLSVENSALVTKMEQLIRNFNLVIEQKQNCEQQLIRAQKYEYQQSNELKIIERVVQKVVEKVVPVEIIKQKVVPEFIQKIVYVDRLVRSDPIIIEKVIPQYIFKDKIVQRFIRGEPEVVYVDKIVEVEKLVAAEPVIIERIVYVDRKQKRRYADEDETNKCIKSAESLEDNDKVRIEDEDSPIELPKQVPSDDNNYILSEDFRDDDFKIKFEESQAKRQAESKWNQDAINCLNDQLSQLTKLNRQLEASNQDQADRLKNYQEIVTDNSAKEEVIQLYEKDIKRLENENMVMVDNFNQMRKLKQSVEKRLETVERQLSIEKQHKQALEQQASTCTDNFNAVKQELEKYRVVVKQYLAEIDKLQNAKQSLQYELLQCRQKANEVSQINQNMEQERHQLYIQIKSLKEEYGDREEQLELFEKYKTAYTQKSIVEDHNKMLRQRLETMETQNARIIELQDNITQLEDDNKRYCEEEAIMVSTINRLQKENEALRNVPKIKHNQTGESRGRQYQAQIQRKEHQITKLQHLILEYEKQLSSANEIKAEYEEIISRNLDKISVLNSKINDAENQSAQTSALMEKLVEELEKQKHLRLKLERKHKHLTQELMNYEKEIFDKNEKINYLNMALIKEEAEQSRRKNQTNSSINLVKQQNYLLDNQQMASKLREYQKVTIPEFEKQIQQYYEICNEKDLQIKHLQQELAIARQRYTKPYATARLTYEDSFISPVQSIQSPKNIRNANKFGKPEVVKNTENVRKSWARSPATLLSFEGELRKIEATKPKVEIKKCSLRSLMNGNLSKNTLLFLMKKIAEEVENKYNTSRIYLCPDNIYILNWDDKNIDKCIIQIELAPLKEDNQLYQAPQIHYQQSNYSECSIVWSLGVILDQILNKRLYFKNKDELMDPKGKYKFSGVAASEVRKILQKALIKDSNQRMSLSNIIISLSLNLQKRKS